MKQKLILERLLDKYEQSVHLYHPDVSTRRVMLRVDKKEFPEYDYENASVRDEWNAAARELELQGLVSLEWIKGRPVLSRVILNLNHVMECYRAVGRLHPKERAETVAARVKERLGAVTVGWIAAWRDDLCARARERYVVPAYCRQDPTQLDALLTAFAVYDALGGETITMRAFSSRCYRDSKFFEREVRDRFLREARQYDSALSEACEQGELGIREQLAFMGIYARPELYELSGPCIVETAAGTIDLAAATSCGLALPSTLVNHITALDLSKVDAVTFIENKTNYDEYIASERRASELAVYHGGFLSPQKRKLFAKIAACLPKNVNVSFWADIDLGGFRMFEQLQQIFPGLEPMRMSVEDVEVHRANGLKRDTAYLSKLRAALDAGEFPLFQAAGEVILEYGVSIEQEAFLV